MCPENRGRVNRTRPLFSGFLCELHKSCKTKRDCHCEDSLLLLDFARHTAMGRLKASSAACAARCSRTCAQGERGAIPTWYLWSKCRHFLLYLFAPTRWTEHSLKAAAKDQVFERLVAIATNEFKNRHFCSFIKRFQIVRCGNARKVALFICPICPKREK